MKISQSEYDTYDLSTDAIYSASNESEDDDIEHGKDVGRRNSSVPSSSSFRFYSTITEWI